MSEKNINVYEQRNAADKIYGYYISRPNENTNTTFERARAECVENLRRQLELVESMEPATFFSVIKPASMRPHTTGSIFGETTP